MADEQVNSLERLNKVKVSEKLTLEQRQAALLEACGYDNRSITSMIGMSVQTVQRWRRDKPEYNEAVQIFQERHVAEMEPLIGRVKTELVELAFEAFGSLREALKAETLDGQPRWPVRNEAAALIMSHLKLVTGEGPTAAVRGSSPEESGGQGGPKSVEIVINAPQQAASAPADIEATVVE